MTFPLFSAGASMALSSGHDLHNFQTVPRRQPAAAEFRRRDRLPVLFHHHAARGQFLAEKKFLDGTGQRGGGFPAVGDDKGGACIHLTVMRLTSGGQLNRNPCTLPTPRVM